MRTKGQAAMDFLTTYGWAFLILVGVIAGMSYFGLFDTGRFVSPSCSLDGNIFCPIFNVQYDFENSDSYEFQINFENYLSDPIYIVDMVISDSTSNGSCHVDIIGDSLNLDGCTPARDLDDDDPIVYSKSCGKIIAPNGNKDLFFHYDDSTCNFEQAGLYEPTEGRKLSFDIKLYYLKGSSNKPSVTSGTIIAPITAK